HGTGDWVASLVRRIREVSIEAQRHVAVMMDVKGPALGTGAVSEPINREIREPFELYTSGSRRGGRGVDVNYAGLAHDVHVGGTILPHSGLIRLEVLEKDDTSVYTRVITPGRIGSRRHINLPGVHVNLPSLTEKDE